MLLTPGEARSSRFHRSVAFWASANGLFSRPARNPNGTQLTVPRVLSLKGEGARVCDYSVGIISGLYIAPELQAWKAKGLEYVVARSVLLQSTSELCAPFSDSPGRLSLFVCQLAPLVIRAFVVGHQIPCSPTLVMVMASKTVIKTINEKWKPVHKYSAPLW